MVKKIVFLVCVLALVMSVLPLKMSFAVDDCSEIGTPNLLPPNLNQPMLESTNPVLIKLTWNFQTQPPTGTFLKICRMDGGSTGSGLKFIGTIAPSSEYFLDQSAEIGTYYQYRVQLCVNTTTCSAYSNPQYVTQTATVQNPPPPTTATPPPPAAVTPPPPVTQPTPPPPPVTQTAPATPANVTATLQTSTTGVFGVKVAWMVAGEPLSGTSFKIWRRIEGTPTTSWVVRGYLTNFANGMNYLDTDVTAGTRYQYQVQACITSSCSSYSDSAFITITLPGTTPPPPPASTTPPPPTNLNPPPPPTVTQSRLIVQTINGNREPLSGVMVEVAALAGTSGTSNIQTKLSEQGTALFTLPVGEYRVRGNLSGYQTPTERTVSVAASVDTTTFLQLYKILNTTTTLGGIVVVGSGQAVADAFVWARSESGQNVQTKSGADGRFQFTLPTNTKWFIGAGKEIDGYAYNAPDRMISLENTTGIVLELVKKMEQKLPPPVTTTAPPTQEVKVVTTDGANVVVPSGAVNADSVSLTIKPTAEAPSQTDARVIGTAYDINLQSSTGQAITQTEKELEITLPFTDTELGKYNVAADKLVPSYYDEATGKWVRLTNFSIDVVRKVFVVKVNHLTRFALVAPADTVPPQPPTNVVVTQEAGGGLKITWTNPTVDFSHVVMYRATSSDAPGTLLDDYVLGTSYVDSTASAGTTWYYRLASVDTAGNQSSDTAAVTVGTLVGSGGAHPNGTLILDGKTVYVIRRGKRLGFRDSAEYNSHGFTFAQVVTANSADKQLPLDSNIVTAREGSLVLDANDGRTVYVIGPNKTKRGFTSMAVLTGLGYKLNGLIKINLSDYASGPPIESADEAHPDGALVLDGKTVWWLWQGRREGFESEAVLKSYGFGAGVIAPANDADRKLPEGALVKFRDGTLVSDKGAIYIISDGKKHPFTSMAALTSRGYNSKNAISGSAGNYEAGPALE